MHVFQNLKLPPIFDLVWVYYKISDGNATAYTLGYWDGKCWRRVSVSYSGAYQERIKEVCGWDEAVPPEVK
jgi:hypothetical protein